MTHPSGLAGASLAADDSVGFPQKSLDVASEPGEGVRGTFERERLYLVSEKTQLPSYGGTTGLQLGADFPRADVHVPLYHGLPVCVIIKRPGSCHD
jgi:hypothetical protein